MTPNGMNSGLTCAKARDQFALLLYGELSFDEEESVESHLDGCAECRAALERQRVLHATLDAVAVSPSPALLAGSREDFSQALLNERGQQSWWSQFLTGLQGNWLRPVGAFALIAIGFFSAHVLPVANLGNSGSQRLNLAGITGASVRNVSAQPDGRVEIVFEDTRQRIVTGRLDDEPIRTLLVSAAREAEDPRLRAGTVAILVRGAESADIRDTLMFALEHDQSTDVRRQAAEGLRPYMREPAVQGVIAEALLREANRSVRTQVIDLLAAQEERELNRQIVGALQELMSREDDTYVRERCRRVLRGLKASAEIY
jgi:hypothetical protein